MGVSIYWLSTGKPFIDLLSSLCYDAFRGKFVNGSR